MISWNRGHDPDLYATCRQICGERSCGETRSEQEHLVKLFGTAQILTAIPFDTLPAEYVIKTNHGSAQMIVVKGKADRRRSFKDYQHG